MDQDQQHDPAPALGQPGTVQQPPAAPRKSWIRRDGPWLACSVIIALVIAGIVIPRLSGSSGTSCQAQASSWWHTGGGESHWTAEDDGLTATHAQLITLTSLSSSSSARQAETDGAALASAAKGLAAASETGLDDLPPSCDAQLDRDLATAYQAEGNAAVSYETAGQDIAGGDDTDAEATATQAGSEQDTANTDIATVLADIKVLTGN
jgi:hypothetical protein